MKLKTKRKPHRGAVLVTIELQIKNYNKIKY